MSPFEFVTVLISIILGLGITQIMSGVADLIHQWEKVKLYWVHGLWVVLVFVLHVQQWWLTWELRMILPWRLPFFLFEILYPINLFILARILFPLANESAEVDLQIFYFRNYKKFFLMLIILSTLSAIENILVYKLGFEGWAVNAAIAIGLTVVVIKNVQSAWIHKLIVVLLVVAMLSGIIIKVDEWLITE